MRGDGWVRLSGWGFFCCLEEQQRVEPDRTGVGSIPSHYSSRKGLRE